MPETRPYGAHGLPGRPHQAGEAEDFGDQTRYLLERGVRNALASALSCRPLRYQVLRTLS